ncbi:MAG: phytanoyl-CoA dioxygenase family protein [Pyrinomonadaceae bacterium]
MQDAVKTYGVKEFSRPSSDLDKHVEEIKLLGYTILPCVLSDSELKSARQKIDHIYQVQLEEIGGERQLEIIGDIYVAMCLLAYDEFFLSIATHPKVMPIIERFLGDYFVLLLQNGIINVPDIGNEQNPACWHRDLGYQHFISTRPLSITALFCIDDFSEEMGGTYVLPASHKTELFPSEEFVKEHERVVNAKAGSVIVLDAMLYHRGGHNRSQQVRRGVNNIYTLPLIKQQINLPKMLKGKYRDDAFLRKLLGYESEPDESVIEFRKKRLRRAGVS